MVETAQEREAIEIPAFQGFRRNNKQLNEIFKYITFSKMKWGGTNLIQLCIYYFTIYFTTLG